MVEEKTEGTEEGLRVVGTKIEGDSLYIELASSDRDELVNKGRTFALEQATLNPEFGSWSRAGVEKVSSPVAFDPNDPNNDPYSDKPNTNTKWHYKQTLRLTRSPI